MEFDEIIVKESPGLCRCCLSEGCYKDMGTEYAWMNENEVYADMLLECFDISISQLNDGPNGPNRLICEVCITRLRDACYFKKQVLESEKKFIDMVGRGEFKSKAILVSLANMKAETADDDDAASFGTDDADPEYLDDEIEYLEEDILKAETQEPGVSDVTADPLPVRGKRGRPRKDPVKADKKKVKTEPKPKSSKPALKEAEISVRTRGRQTFKSKIGDHLQLLTVIIHNSTIMPFRWYSNKFLCFYCWCPFVDSCSLKEHTKSEHDEPKIKLKLLITMLRKTRIKLDVSDVTCKQCHKTLQTLEEYVSHASSEHNMNCNKNVCKDFFTFKLTDDDIRCLECGQTFKFFGTLVKHVHKYHNKSNAFQCDTCNEKFISKHNLNSHIKNVHGQTECEKCQKVFPTHYALKCHIKKCHIEKAQSRPLKCPKCPEILTSRYHKQRHLANVHNDESSQNKCDICFKDFAWRSQMLRHKNEVHLKEKSFACDVCGFRTSSTELLKKHMVCHDDSRPYKCEYCPKTFRRKKGHDLHTRIHTNDKRYVCKECGQAFVQGTSLKLHVRVHHSGNKKT